MGIPRWVDTNRRSYFIVDATTWVSLALIAGRVVDEITGQPLPVTYSLLFDFPNLEAKFASSGFFCLSGYPERAFPHLDNTNYLVQVKIQAKGYQEAQFSVPVQAGSTFPIAVPDIQLAPNPVRIQGKVTTLDGDPIPNARVVLVEEPNLPQPPAFHPLWLRASLAAAHPAGARIHRRALVPAGPAKQLTAPAPAGSRSLQLDSRSQLAIGDVLRIGPEETGEFRRIEGLPNLGNLNQPGVVILTLPLGHSHAAAAPIRWIRQDPITFTTRLARPARQGSGILLLDDPLVDESIQVDDLPAAVEFQAIGALSNSQGDYRIDGIEGLRTIFLRASAAGFNPMVEPAVWTVDYSQPVNIVNLQLP